MKLRAVRDYLICKQVRELEQSRSGLWTPRLPTRQPKGFPFPYPSGLVVYEVLSVGPRVRDRSIKPGTLVVASWTKGVRWKLDGQEYCTLEEAELDGTVEEV